MSKIIEDCEDWRADVKPYLGGACERVIEVYMKRGMREDEARDFFFYNCEAAFISPYAPRYEWEDYDQ